MNCLKCGEVCSCPMEPPVADVSAESLTAPAPSGGSSSPQGQDPGTAWRDELSSRLNRYRARRKAPPPRYPSLHLPFERIEPRTSDYPQPEDLSVHTFEHASNNALALDGMQEVSAPFPETQYPVSEPDRIEVPAAVQSTSPSTAKIIEFPRFSWAPPVPPPDQLAEPVMDRPRILEVPEFTPPPPALGGITIEPVEVDEPAKRPGIDMPLHPAPLGLRIVAALTDGAIIAVATALFGCIFWKVSGIQPPRLQILGMATGILLVSWAVYQYLLIVHSARTPGLALAHLELTRFDGSPTRRSLRRWRVLASFLSAVSLGMGYVWVFLDEDSLCWHDRITRTYLAPRATDAKKI